jgi:histidine ammonia-lyase
VTAVAQIPVQVDGTGLTVEQVAAVAHAPVSVALSASGRARAAASHAFAEQTLLRRPLYGRTTGVGANRTVPLTGDPQENVLRLLRSHATSAGPVRSAARIRAMLLVRLNQLAAGGSGVAPHILDGLQGLLDHGVLPDVRELGSIGTGDLPALATTALALLGEGRTPTGLPAVPFGAADGLAFISSNAATLGDAALAVAALTESGAAALAIAALTFAAVNGNAEAYSDGALAATPFAGAAVVCRALRPLIGADRFGSRLDTAGRPVPAARIQDPYGLRALPQVHGPVLDQLRTARSTVERSVNAPTENPLLLADPAELDGGLIAHHAGFHATYLQTAVDGLNLAVARSCQLVLGRLAMLMEPSFTGLAPFLGDGTPAASGLLILEYVAASALGAIRTNAAPAGLQSVTVSRGAEEDASFASLAAARALEVARDHRQLIACELVAAVRALRRQPERPRAGLVEELLAAAASLPTDAADRDLTEDLAIAIDLVPAFARLVPAE